MALPVRLHDIIDALEGVADFNMHFLDKRTGEIFMLTEEEWHAAEEDELVSAYPEWQREVILKAREIQNSEHFAELPDQFEIFEYEMMSRFTRQHKDRAISRRLSGSIQGSGAFR